MKKILLVLILFISLRSMAQTADNAAVMLSATVNKVPPSITLTWTADAGATSYTVYRKLKTDANWMTELATFTGTATSYTDNSVSSGTSYEYYLFKVAPTYEGYGYINSGIELPLTESRGKIILVVDNTFTTTLAAELSRLEKDLEGDGWKTVRINVNRTDAVSAVKASIVSTYTADAANVKAVFLIGHVPVPYSGNFNPDAHPDHKGAWPADVFYGEMNGTWTDATVNSTVATDSRQHNIPGDGKYDNVGIPTDVELQVGRVDFYNMPAFSLTETQLLKNYLDKDHDYRHKVFTAQSRALIDDHFGYFSSEAFAASGWSNLSTLVGKSNVSSLDYFTTLAGNSYKWSYGCGPGTFVSASGVGTTTDFAAANNKAVFTMLFGSYFGDWDTQNNFLRAALAQGQTLTNVWSGRPHWRLHHMAMGETIGYSTQLTQNNSGVYFGNYALDQVHIALMGDPTLRNDVTAPVTGLEAKAVGTGIVLSWTPSADATNGYLVYKKDNSTGDLVKLTATPTTLTTFSESCIMTPATYTYMVKSVQLITSASGSYFNTSQGISDTANFWFNNKAVASFTVSSTPNVLTFTNTSTNALSYTWSFGDGSTSSAASPVKTYPAAGTYTISLTAANVCHSDVKTYSHTFTTGTEEREQETISVFPNPTHGLLTVEGMPGNEEARVIITDMAGRTVADEKLQGKREFDLSGESPGLYLITVRQGHNQVSRTRIIKQ